jgi:hypothetical protein
MKIRIELNGPAGAIKIEVEGGDQDEVDLLVSIALDAVDKLRHRDRNSNNANTADLLGNRRPDTASPDRHSGGT